MDTLLDNGIEITLWVQSLGDWLLPVMSFFSFIGSEPFFLFLAPTIYWCLDPVLGIRAGLYLLINGGVNAMLKVLFHAPRPYWYSGEVKALSTESSFGAPSGHAQTSVVIWGTIAKSIRTRWAWIFVILLIFFIGLSRIYLGVHFPSDVLLGWIIGIVLLWLLLWLEDPFLSWFNNINRSYQVILLVIGSLSFVFLFVLISTLVGEGAIPQVWIETASQAAPDEEPLNPLSISSIVSYAGAFLGMAIGAIWMRARGWFSTKDPLMQLLLRYLLGLVGVIVLYSGLGTILPHGEDLVSLIFRYFRYAFVGVWITAGAPVLFIRLKLAKSIN